MNKNIMELVIFKTKPEVSEETFFRLFHALNQVLKHDVDGFVKRTISKDAAQDTWAEMIWWDSMESAQAALDTIPLIPKFQQYCAILQKNGMSMLHLEEQI